MLKNFHYVFFVINIAFLCSYTSAQSTWENNLVKSSATPDASIDYDSPDVSNSMLIGDDKEAMFSSGNSPKYLSPNLKKANAVKNEIKSGNYEQAYANLKSGNLNTLKAYLCYKGYGVEKDLDECDSLLEKGDILTWKNFYVGKYAPYDRRFAIYMLKKETNKLLASYFLYQIYSGNLNPRDKNTAEAEKWETKYKEELKIWQTMEINNWNSEIVQLESELKSDKTSVKAMRKLALKHLIKHKYRGIHFNKRIFVENPNYNPQRAKELFSQSGFTDWQTYSAMIEVLGRDETGDDEDMYKALQEALKSDSLSNDQKTKLENKAKELEQKRRSYFQAPPIIDTPIIND